MVDSTLELGSLQLGTEMCVQWSNSISLQFLSLPSIGITDDKQIIPSILARVPRTAYCFCWVSGQVSTAILCPKSCAAACVLGADPYVLIKCENQSVRSSVQHDTTSAVFDTQVIFYKKNIDSPVIVQVR